MDITLLQPAMGDERPTRITAAREAKSAEIVLHVEYPLSVLQTLIAVGLFLVAVDHAWLAFNVVSGEESKAEILTTPVLKPLVHLQTLEFLLDQVHLRGAC